MGFGIGWTEILVILVVALLVLGPTKLPEIAKGLGKGIRDFKKAISSLEDEEPRKQAVHSTPVTRETAPSPKPDTGTGAEPRDNNNPSE